MVVQADKLYQLIRSLSKSEKRYFRVFAARHVMGEENDYIRLFSLYDSLPAFDEKKVLLLAKEKGLKINYLPQLRQYLQSLVLKSLHAFHASRSAEARLAEILHQVQLLYNKDLTGLARQLTARGKKMAMENDRPLFHIEFLKWERVFVMETLGPDKSEAYMERYNETIQSLLEQEKSYFDAARVRDRFTIREVKEGKPRDAGQAREMDDMYRELQRIQKRSHINYFTQRVINLSSYLYYNLKGDFIHAYDFARQQVAYIESRMHLLRGNYSPYLAALHNQLVMEQNMCLYDNFKATIARLRSLPDQFPDAKTESNLKMIFYARHLEVNLYMQMGHFSEGVDQVKQMEEELRRFEGISSRVFTLLLCYNIACLYFGAGDFHRSLKWLNRILNDPGYAGVREDVLSFARIMNLLVHYELGNAEMLDHFIRSAYRYIKKRKMLYRIEELFFSFFRKIISIKDPDELQKSYIRLRGDLGLLEQDPEEKQGLEHFDLISWLDSKIEKRNFQEVVKQKAEKQRRYYEMLMAKSK